MDIETYSKNAKISGIIATAAFLASLTNNATYIQLASVCIIFSSYFCVSSVEFFHKLFKRILKNKLQCGAVMYCCVWLAAYLPLNLVFIVGAVYIWGDEGLAALICSGVYVLHALLTLLFTYLIEIATPE